MNLPAVLLPILAAAAATATILPASAQAPSASSPTAPASPAAAAEAPTAPKAKPEDLARPLRKYDTDKDGKLTGDELRLARQAFNRGGKAPEMSSDDWQGVLDYFKGDWRKRNFAKLDLNADGQLDENEKKRVQTIWNEIAAKLTSTRAELVTRHDKNDDGNVTREERRAFDPEFNQRRREIESEILEKHTAAPPAPPTAPSESTPTPTPPKPAAS